MLGGLAYSAPNQCSERAGPATLGGDGVSKDVQDLNRGESVGEQQEQTPGSGSEVKEGGHLASCPPPELSGTEGDREPRVFQGPFCDR